MCQRGFKLREKLAHSYIGQPLPDSIHLLPSTPQIKGLHTFIRNKDTPRDEFIFYSKRLIRLVIEYTLSLLPFKVSYSLFKRFSIGTMMMLVSLVQES
jgi:uridine kinase